MNTVKVYVDVEASFDCDGLMLPRSLTWEDGSVYEIDRVIAIRQAPAMKAGGQGDRYTVVLENRERYLFFERPTDAEDTFMVGRWFVEAPA